jgi:hypothetical protein
MPIASAVVVVTVLLALTLWPSGSRTQPAGSEATPIAARHLPPDLEFERHLFREPSPPDNAASQPDAPVLAGIAGRLPDNAIAMIRDGDGATRVVAIGQRHNGWRLDSLSSDAALFTRGTQHVRVALPTGGDEPAAE